MLILQNLHRFLNLPQILLQAPEVDRPLAVVIHDVAAQLPDGPLELVAVELQLRQAAADSLERMQQALGLLLHALLHGRHDRLLGVVLLPTVHVHERPHHPLLLLQILRAAARLVEGAAGGGGVGGEAERAGDGGGGGARGGRHGRRGREVARVFGLAGGDETVEVEEEGVRNPRRRKGRGK